jgi:hypothetical protein
MVQSLQIALKEWDVVCQAMGDGQQIILLRKGGIAEAAGGFELEHPQFLFFPTFVHQNAGMLKPQWQDKVQRLAEEPTKVKLALAGEITDIVKLQSREQMQRTDGSHIWSDALIDMRFNYRPWNPLYLLLVRVYRLASVGEVENTAAYAGCKSWVPLERAIDCAGATPVLDDLAYASLRAKLLEQIEISE